MVSAEEHAKVEKLWRVEKAKNKIFEDALKDTIDNLKEALKDAANI
jgi:hypothetical protein